MINGNDLICFCNDWDGDPLSKKQIVTRLAKQNRILWVNSTGTRNPTISAHDFRRAWKKLKDFSGGSRTVSENISVFCPLVIPFHGNRLARWMNRHILSWSLRRACRALGFRKPITLTFVPSSAGVVGSLGEHFVIYYCVDEYTRFTGTDQTAIANMERGLMERSDLVIVSSSRLLETKLPYNRNTRLISHGVDVDHFRKACFEETAIPADCPVAKGPVIGFFGLVADWVDLEVVRYLAKARPEWTVLMIGEIRTDVSALRELPNVHMLGRKDYKSLPGYCKAFSVAILPFLVNELTLAANPLKLREYLAAGLPLVATPLPEVCKLGSLVRTALSPEDFLREVEASLNLGKHGPDRAVSRCMDGDSWDVKVEELSGHIEDLRGESRRRAPAIAAEQVA